MIPELISEATRICRHRNKKIEKRKGILTPKELRNGVIHAALDTIDCSIYSLTPVELIKVLDNMLQDYTDELKSIRKL